jgi:hypothetical protein
VPAPWQPAGGRVGWTGPPPPTEPPPRRGSLLGRLLLPFRLLLLPFQRVLGTYLRELLRAMLPWLLPLALLAALPYILARLAGH